jgi:hypothetical protein
MRRSRPPTRARLFACVLACLAGLGVASPAAAAGAPPHAWLFGSWTGGLFPAPSNVTASVCLAQPVVVFTRDVVMRATLTDVTYTQRVIATARTNPGVTEFQFAPAAPQTSGLFGAQAAAPIGFGCGSPDVLHVQRRSDNEITFPGCAEFPNPLVRCPSR